MSGLSQFSWEPQRREQTVITECIKPSPRAPKNKGHRPSLALQLPHQANQDPEDTL